MSVFDSTHGKDFLSQPCFFGDSVAIARYDQQRYPFIEKLIKQQLGFFWVPEEVDVTKDIRDFRLLTDHEQHIFTSNLKRQILLDSVQGRAPSLAFGPVVSLPELETWIATWTFNETIHSRSYTHIIRNVYSNPSIIFDEITNIAEIVDCAKDISYWYDELIGFNQEPKSDPYWHRQALWMALMSVNILEGIRFYVSFACSWAFAELKKMEGNAKIIKLICRDENLHLAGTQQLLKILPQEDSLFKEIQEKNKENCEKLFIAAAEQEMKWAEYLFKDGSMIGLNSNLLVDYVKYITTKRMNAVGLHSPYKVTTNPLPWTNKWISGSEVQVAPQETEISSYITGNIKQDISAETLGNLSL